MVKLDFLHAFLAPLHDLLDDPSVSEISYNGDRLWIERNGRMLPDERVLTASRVVDLISVLARSVGREVMCVADRSALLDARMEGFRVAAVLPPVALRGPVFSIRRHAERSIPLASYLPATDVQFPGHRLRQPLLPTTRAELLSWLESLLAAPLNVLVSGGTSTGKTSFINSLLRGIPSTERVLTLEDTAELRVEVPNWVALEAHPDHDLQLRDLVRMALRLRPDRILVGEIRGAEAFDLMQALNTGHSGAATLHANSALAALHRLETLTLSANVGWPLAAIRNQIANTVDYVIHLTRRAGSREIGEVLALRGTNDDGNYQHIRIWPPAGIPTAPERDPSPTTHKPEVVYT